jgi:hypothetical protein
MQRYPGAPSAFPTLQHACAALAFTLQRAARLRCAGAGLNTNFQRSLSGRPALPLLLGQILCIQLTAGKSILALL